MNPENTGSRPTCEICGRNFSRKDGLYRHMRSIHSATKKYECSDCELSFSRKDTLDRHVNDVHKQIRKHVCTECGEKFKQPGTLKRHIQTMHERKIFFDCPHCDASFPRDDSLIRHVNAVHLNLRPHICKECGAAFKLPDHLRQHIISLHTNQRQFICEECGFAFKLLQHLNDHIKVVHQNHRPHVCEECESVFPHTRDLKLHIIAMHTDEKPFVCEECGRGFADPSHLYRHKQAEACWFTSTTAYKWEELCKEIAEVLFVGENWVWKPKIDTPELEEQTWIQPEIVVYYKDNTKRIIDAKRSTQAIFKEKDLKVYPKVAEKVEFWCLYGKAEGMFEEEEEIEAKDSNKIITELEKRKDVENQRFLDNLIMKIQLLKKGIDYEGQTVMDVYSSKK